jgi:DNA-binding CsgD family transcriptional regulator
MRTTADVSSHATQTVEITVGNESCLEWANPAHERRNAPRVCFTRRQLDVLCLLCEGLPNKVISTRLKISPGTVKIHVGNILRKLGVSSRLQAVVSARRRGLVTDAQASVSDQMFRAQPQAYVASSSLALSETPPAPLTGSNVF